ncbi:hypothetical protein OH809_12835 [Streptomyces sp. NBC_00873]|uniref:hypothetical protein n=1 Tax=Streptomyces sp. NBC_00873 TaxID=2975852 RepID=UPI0038679258|nr:hypothetical protein OH809_12835 [Streptomyces sp. NBC_00873]
MSHELSDPEDTCDVPITVHRAAGAGGRRVTIRAQTAGLAHSDADVVEFLRRAGLPDADDVLDDPRWVKWQGGRPHEYGAA